MKELIADRLMKLLSVKSLVTIIMTAVLAVLLLSEHEPSRELLTMYSTSYGSVITYFFTKKENADV